MFISKLICCLYTTSAVKGLNKAGIIYLFSYDRFGTMELMTLFINSFVCTRIVTLGHDLDFFRKSFHE